MAIFVFHDFKQPRTAIVLGKAGTIQASKAHHRANTIHVTILQCESRVIEASSRKPANHRPRCGQGEHEKSGGSKQAKQRVREKRRVQMQNSANGMPKRSGQPFRQVTHKVSGQTMFKWCVDSRRNAPKSKIVDQQLTKVEEVALQNDTCGAWRRCPGPAGYSGCCGEQRSWVGIVRAAGKRVTVCCVSGRDETT